MSSSAAAVQILERLRLTPGLSSLALLEAPRQFVETRLPVLDALLGGGLPCTVTELVGARSSGRTALAHALAAATTNAGELVAWVDLPDAFDAEHAVLAGVQLPRLLWVRPQGVRAALRATEHVVAAGGFRLVLLDLDEQHGGAPAIWLRLARTATRNGAAVVVLGARRAAGAFASLSLEISRRRACFSPQHEPCPLFHGFDGQVRLCKSRQAPLSDAGACVRMPAVA